MPGLFFKVFQVVNIFVKQFSESFAFGLAFVSFFFHGLYLMIDIFVVVDLIFIVLFQLLIDGDLPCYLVFPVLNGPVEVSDFPEDFVDVDIIFVNLDFGVVKFIPELGDVGPGDV